MYAYLKMFVALCEMVSWQQLRWATACCFLPACQTFGRPKSAKDRQINDCDHSPNGCNANITRVHRSCNVLPTNLTPSLSFTGEHVLYCDVHAAWWLLSIEFFVNCTTCTYMHAVQRYLFHSHIVAHGASLDRYAFYLFGCILLLMNACACACVSAATGSCF